MERVFPYRAAGLTTLAALVVVSILLGAGFIKIGGKYAMLKEAKNLQVALACYDADHGSFPVGRFERRELTSLLQDVNGKPYITTGSDGAELHYVGGPDYELLVRNADADGTCLIVTPLAITAISADSAATYEVLNAMDSFSRTVRWITARYDVAIPTSLAGYEWQTAAEREADGVFTRSLSEMYVTMRTNGYRILDYYRSDYSNSPSNFYLIVRGPGERTMIATLDGARCDY